MSHGYKVFTHDFRSPLQGGDPVWDGETLPFVLPTVRLDRSDAECAAGWNYCQDLAVAFQIAGFWPTGRPSVAIVVAPDSGAECVDRGDKCRASSLTLLRVATSEEISAAIGRLSLAFRDHADTMAREQVAWRAALNRPRRDAAAVEHSLVAALQARGLRWALKRYETVRDAKDALTMMYAGLRQWIDVPPDRLTVGLREAYLNGLETVIPIAPDTLGWVMTEGRP